MMAVDHVIIPVDRIAISQQLETVREEPAAVRLTPREEKP
jgi:hypothetical protein